MRIDFHSHILPEMDDGSRNAEMTKIMLEKEYDGGIELCSLTPHYYATEETAAEFVERREESFSKLKGIYYEEGMPRLILGAEIEMYRGMWEDDLSPLCLGATNILLCEMPMFYEDYVVEELSELVCGGFVPMVAHFERYFPTYREKQIREILDVEGCVFQINTHSLGSRRIRNKLYELADDGFDFVLGTDAHNITTRPPVIPNPLNDEKKSRAFGISVEKTEDLLLELLKQ